ncbi:MAG: ribonuclease HII [Deltaproteobacteria bacterium]|nr:ribonuclease HII [Deltaproteobacteria bacterium]
MVKASNNLSFFKDTGDKKAADPLYYESAAYKDGYNMVAGIDEAGRGPLAGPVVSAAVIMPKGLIIPGVKDSKKMSEKAREKAFLEIIKNALAVGIGVVSHSYIDKHNILTASLESMKVAVDHLDITPDFLLIDGIFKIQNPLPQKCIVKGDQLSHTISAASVIAKVYRDRIMSVYDRSCPEYEFIKNKGYGTKQHLTAIKKYGPSPFHRMTFKGVY